MQVFLSKKWTCKEFKGVEVWFYVWYNDDICKKGFNEEEVG